MIRRKIWATATCCLALAGAARAQTGSTPKATISVPKFEAPAYIARGVSPNPGYPKFVPRNYVAPNSPTYAAPVADINAVPPTAVPAPAALPAPTELFAVDGDAAVQVAPTPGSPMPAPVVGPAPSIVGPAPSVVESPVVTPGPVPPGTVVTSPMANGQMYSGPMISGGPMTDAPFLDGTDMCGQEAMPHVWLTAEFLCWQFRGVDIPPLITTAPAGSPGTLDDAATTVLYGENGMYRDWNAGYRIRGGFWLPDGKSGVDLGFFNIGKTTERSSYTSDGAQGLFRPFFNTAAGAEDALLVAFTDPINGPLVAGTVSATYDSMLFGAEANYRMGWGMGFGGRLDCLIGYRYLQLHDRITIQSSVTTLQALGAAPAGTVINSRDVFEAKNQFNGGQVGIVGEWQIGMMTFGLRGTVALGVTTQEVDINGSTTAGAVSSPGGLLALPGTNMGSYTRTRCSIVPEVGVNLGYQVTNNCRIFGGYNLLYWTHTVRAGEQINRNVNATYIADPTTGVATPAGAPAPPFHHRDEHFYAHGLTLGVEFRW